MQSKEEEREHETPNIKQAPALLTNTEIEWLLGKIKVSKSFEYKMRNSIKRKVQTLTEFELPLLFDNQFIRYHDASYGIKQRGLGWDLEPDLPSSRQVLSANPSLGKAKVLGPNPSQGCFCLSKIPRFLLIHGYKPSQTLTKYSKGLTKYDKIEVRNNYG
jgi:hypothetical protein